MNTSIKRKCELLAANRDAMKNAFKWDNSLIYPLCAYIYTERGLPLDSGKIREARDIIKRNVGIFSNFRGISKNVFATMLSLEASFDAVFSDIQSVYSKLKREFYPSNYLPLAAFIIARATGANDSESVVSKSKSIYKLMKAEHPFLTSGEDCTYAALFALSDKTDTEIVCEAESCYTILKGRFFSSNALQNLSHVLALGEEAPEAKCSRAVEIFQQLKTRGLKYGTRYELATLGVLALCGGNAADIADSIAEANEYLRSFKGFGALAIGAKQRLMYAAMLTSTEYFDRATDAELTAALNSVTALIIAGQAAVAAAIAASSASASH